MMGGEQLRSDSHYLRGRFSAAPERGVAGDPSMIGPPQPQIDRPAARAAMNHFDTIERLLATLSRGTFAARRQAAEALVGTYRTGALAPGERVLLLAQRPAITMAHSDYQETSLCYKHEDNGGIGVEFPR
jgi:hypothetical protein